MQIRPTRLTEVIGQKKAKECLEILITSAKKRNEALPHILFLGRAGTGKTTLAGVVANELGCKIHITNGGVIKQPKDIMKYVMFLKHRHVLFIDEVHRMKEHVQEFMFPIMEDFYVPLLHRQQLKPFTVIGATTETGMLLKPFRERFTTSIVMESYTPSQLVELAQQNSRKYNINLDRQACNRLAAVCRETPRLLNNMLKWLQAYADKHQLPELTEKHVLDALTIQGIDKYGLSRDDYSYLSAFENTDKPLGLKTLVAHTGLSAETIEHVIEPYLLQLNVIQKTSRGRILNENKY